MFLSRRKIQISIGKDQHCRRGLNSKINSIIGKQQQVQKLKERAEFVSSQLKSKEPGGPDQRRRKTYVKQDETI